jgi:predicted RNA-binding protein YlxR (DUF448 family)
MLALIDSDELDTGPKGHGAERFCAVTREVKPIAELIRFVVAPDRSVVVDVKHKLPGRGLWVTATREALAEAVRRKVFARGFKTEVLPAPDLVAATELLLERSALDALAIAGKAGQVVAGFSKVDAALGRDKVVGLIHARDAAADGIRKIDAAMRRQFGDDAERPAVIAAFTSSQLDLALARSNVVHAALLAGGASEGFIARALRLKRFRSGGAGNPADQKNGQQGAQGRDTE